ncbi:hypothetical protein IFM89_021432 [Coptis chinensis]|uniref:Uncharacterized protein n=1 Tax=Coptis chinensis TaxID=261450 RepID=A0A835M0Y9_9MAGN|nr:hypothetical protein IFM89_021432 [Coptis chinensis]
MALSWFPVDHSFMPTCAKCKGQSDYLLGFEGGRIPASIGNLLSLTTLDLSHQNFSGEVPIELSGFSSLSSLRYLNLTTNALSGEIPATYGFQQGLLVLSLSDNCVSGTIPTELGNCSNLEVLVLRSNRLTGGLPVDLSRLSHLKELDLGNNNFSGQIPEEISQCTMLTSLLLNENCLSETFSIHHFIFPALNGFNGSTFTSPLLGQLYTHELWQWLYCMVFSLAKYFNNYQIPVTKVKHLSLIVTGFWTCCGRDSNGSKGRNIVDQCVDKLAKDIMNNGDSTTLTVMGLRTRDRKYETIRQCRWHPPSLKAT